MGGVRGGGTVVSQALHATVCEEASPGTRQMAQVVRRVLESLQITMEVKVVESLEVGQKAPEFEGQTSDGSRVSLASLRGKVVVLYFYPKDDTPGCTKEACAFRDANDELKELGAVVLGVSRDTVASHQKFTTKYDLNFPLIADVDEAICQAYGVIREKNLYGKKSMGVVRTTFVIDSDGNIAHIFNNVKVDGHAEKVLDIVRTLV